MVRFSLFSRGGYNISKSVPNRPLMFAYFLRNFPKYGRPLKGDDYGDRELIRRLRNGWEVIGADFPEFSAFFRYSLLGCNIEKSEPVQPSAVAHFLRNFQNTAATLGAVAPRR